MFVGGYKHKNIAFLVYLLKQESFQVYENNILCICEVPRMLGVQFKTHNFDLFCAYFDQIFIKYLHTALQLKI